MPQIKYNPESILRVVKKMGLGTKMDLRRERQLEWRRMEREHVEPGRQQVEHRQSGLFSRNYRISSA